MNKSTNTALTLFLAVASLTVAGCLSSGDDGSGLVNSAPDDGGGSSNTAPTISGNPPSAVLVGEAYSYSPSASDADGDALTFSIQNKPSWASFDTKTGQVSGTPTMVNIGMYTNIAVTVSDGQASASTPQFSVEVTQVQLGSVTLSWTAPTQNADGSSLTDLDAFKIYYGNSQGSYPNQILIDNPSITTYVIDNLTPNTYFFVATSVNQQGVESEFSNIAQVSVN